MNYKFHTLSLLIFLLCSIGLSSCNKDDIQAENSINGIWNVTEIYSLYANFTQNGFNNPTETLTETGALGFFHFEGENVEYQFTRNDTLYTGNRSHNWDF